MNEWQPKWKVNYDSVPVPAVYSYPDGSFSVAIDQHGVIEVKRNDWLSKYALAIHGATNPLPDFLRYDPSVEGWVKIRNVDLIFEGEYLIHAPSFEAWEVWENFHSDRLPERIEHPPDVPVDPELPREWSRYALDVVTNPVLGASTGAIDTILMFTKYATVQAGFTVIGAVLIPLTAINDILTADDFSVNGHMYLAGAYAATAWVFDDLYKSEPARRRAGSISNAPILRFPVRPRVADPNRWLADLQQPGGPTRPEDRVQRYIEAWQDATELVINKLDQKFISMRDNPDDEHFRQSQQEVHLPKRDSAGDPSLHRPNRREYFRVYLESIRKYLRRTKTHPIARLHEEVFDSYKLHNALPMKNQGESTFP